MCLHCASIKKQKTKNDSPSDSHRRRGRIFYLFFFSRELCRLCICCSSGGWTVVWLCASLCAQTMLWYTHAAQLHTSTGRLSHMMSHDNPEEKFDKTKSRIKHRVFLMNDIEGLLAWHRLASFCAACNEEDVQRATQTSQELGFYQITLQTNEWRNVFLYFFCVVSLSVLSLGFN